MISLYMFKKSFYAYLHNNIFHFTYTYTYYTTPSNTNTVKHIFTDEIGIGLTPQTTIQTVKDRKNEDSSSDRFRRFEITSVCVPQRSRMDG